MSIAPTNTETIQLEQNLIAKRIDKSVSLSTRPLSRNALERLDLLLLVIEGVDLNGSQSMLWISSKLGLEEQFPNLVEIWKCRSHNPLRKVTRRGLLKSKESDALIQLICKMSERNYPLLRQLISTKDPDSIKKEKWSLFYDRISSLVEDRLNHRRGIVQRLLNPELSKPLLTQLILSLTLSVGEQGFYRLKASLMDPLP